MPIQNNDVSHSLRGGISYWFFGASLRATFQTSRRGSLEVFYARNNAPVPEKRSKAPSSKTKGCGDRGASDRHRPYSGPGCGDGDVHLDISGATPPSQFPWPYEDTPEAHERNINGIKQLAALFGPTMSVANDYAESVGLVINWLDRTATTSPLAVSNADTAGV
jgi:hypothetical protein